MMGYMNMRHWYQEDCNKNMEFMNMRHQKLKITYAKMSRKNTIVKNVVTHKIPWTFKCWQI